MPFRERKIASVLFGIVALCLVASCTASAQSPVRNVSALESIGTANPQERVFLEYLGEFGADSVIRLTVERRGKTVSGSYFYKRKLVDIPLEGEFITDRDIVLHETNKQGLAGATFSLSFAQTDPRGHFTDSPLKDEVLTGSWSNADNTESHPVYLYLIGQMHVPAGASRYSIAGATDDILLEKNAQAFYEAILRGNRLLAAKYVSYPISFYAGGKEQEARNRTEFLRNYDAIFTKNFLSRIADGIPHDMIATSDGVILGKGEVWFDSKGLAIRLNN